MSDQHTVYFSDDEEKLAEWVENHKEVFGGRSDFYKRALILMRKNYSEMIAELSEEPEELDMLT